VTRDEPFAQLVTLLPAQFEQVLFRARIPPEYLSASSTAQATRAIEAIRYLEQQHRIPELARAIECVLMEQGSPQKRDAHSARARAGVAVAAATGITALALLAVAIVSLVVVLGLYLAPAPVQRFDVTIFLHGKAGRQAVVLRNRGKVWLDLGADKRIEAVGDKGEVRFAGIPGDMRDREVALGLEDDMYELVKPELAVRLNQEAIYAAIQPRQLLLVGYVSDQQGRSLPQARAVIAKATSVADQDGRFEIVLPRDLPEGEDSITITATGYQPWRGQAVPGGDPLRVRLSPSSDGI
jgi:hypothetical protein